MRMKQEKKEDQIGWGKKRCKARVCAPSLSPSAEPDFTIPVTTTGTYSGRSIEKER